MDERERSDRQAAITAPDGERQREASRALPPSQQQTLPPLPLRTPTVVGCGCFGGATATASSSAEVESAARPKRRMTAFFDLPIRPEVRVVRRRHGLRKLAVAAPLFSILAGRTLLVALRRAAGARHPHGWSAHEELLVALMRTFLCHGDIGVWRAFFRNVASAKQQPADVISTPIERAGSRSLWFELVPELRPAAPRARFTLAFVHGGAFAAGSARQYQLTYSDWLKRLAARGVACRVLSVGYPLAPEHRYPEGRDSVAEDIAWLLGEVEGTGPVVIGEESLFKRGWVVAV